MANFIYAGIGSRETPKQVLKAMEWFAEQCAELGGHLRSGGADGADKAFETGCKRAHGLKSIFIPWEGFSSMRSDGVTILNPPLNPEALAIAEKFHPNWSACSDGAKLLHTRNVYQVLGVNLNEPCNFIVCYTKNGTGSGGTGQALRIAQAYGIRIFDLGTFDLYPEKERKELIDSFLADLIKAITEQLGF